MVALHSSSSSDVGSPEKYSVILHAFYISEGHNYIGRHGKGSMSYGAQFCEEIQCVADQGIVGDRFFKHRENFKGQITFFSREVFAELGEHVEGNFSPASLRRNVLIEGVSLNDLIGKEFVIQGLRFFGTEECRPCYWMNEAVAENAEEFLKGRGGLRAKILTDGTLNLGSASLKVVTSEVTHD